MKVLNSDKLSPYGEIAWMASKDAERLIYVYKIFFEAEDFKPPAAWFTLSALGDRIYYKARDRATAQRLCDEFHERKGLFTVIPDKSGSIR